MPNDEQARAMNTLVRAFTQAEHLDLKGRESQLLDYLVNHWEVSAAEAEELLTEATIAREVFKRTATNDGKHSTAVRTAVARLRSELDYYFSWTLDGRRQEQRINLPEGLPYILQLEPNDCKLDPVDRFWDAHLVNHLPNTFTHTEPLFFVDRKNRFYIRYLDINHETLEPEAIATEVREYCRKHKKKRNPVAGLTPTFNYQASGELEALQTVRRYMDRRAKVFDRYHHFQIETRLSRKCIESEILGQNIIALGNSRTNGLLKTLQMGCKMLLQNDCITCDLPGHERTFRDDEGIAYALVTRTRNKDERACATLICSNHARAVEKVAAFLTDAKSVEQLYERAKLDPRAYLPSSFQILFRVKIYNLDTPLEAEPWICDFAPSTESVEVARKKKKLNSPKPKK